MLVTTASVSAVIGLGSASAGGAVGTCIPATDWGTLDRPLAAQVLQLVNADRKAKGLEALSVSATLTASAEWKSMHMAKYGYLAHDDPAPPVSRTELQRLAACGYDSPDSAENLAFGSRDAASVMKAWLGNAVHRVEIESPRWNLIGIGVAANASGVLYWTQDFGATSPAAGPAPVTPPATGTATGAVIVNGKPFTTGRIPYGATVDVTNGNLLLTTDTGHVHLYGLGVPAKFKLIRGTDGKRPIVELRLAGGNFSVCKRKTASIASPTKTVRQLWGSGKGRFRTNGKYAAATVRGTIWLTADRCDGTLTRVKRGVVQVTDLRSKRHLTVRAGHAYLTKP
jgi:hypothetical protein